MDESRRWYIKNKVVDILSRRDHSETELKNKLRRNRYLTPEEISFALEFAAQYQLIPTDHQSQIHLAEKFVQTYERKKQGSLKIKKQLANKGLPIPQISDEKQLELARELVALRCSKSQKALTKDKLFRYLLGRGFSIQVASAALKLEWTGHPQTGEQNEDFNS